MNNIFGKIKNVSSTIASGVLGVSLLVVALDSDEAFGESARKKIAKKKKKPSNVWSQVAEELNPTPIPTIAIQQSAPSIPAPSQLQVELPNEPLLDPRDPDLCAQNVLVQNNGVSSRSIIRGEVRGYHQELGEDKILCEVVVYPRGCEQSYLVHVLNRSMTEQTTCQTLAAQHMNRKQVYFEVKNQELDYGVGGKMRKEIVNSYSLQDMTMDEFLQRVANYDRRASIRDQNRIAKQISNMFDGLN